MTTSTHPLSQSLLNNFVKAHKRARKDEKDISRVHLIRLALGYDEMGFDSNVSTYIIFQGLTTAVVGTSAHARADSFASTPPGTRTKFKTAHPSTNIPAATSAPTLNAFRVHGDYTALEHPEKSLLDAFSGHVTRIVGRGGSPGEFVCFVEDDDAKARREDSSL
jgi:hypothetical protein